MEFRCLFACDELKQITGGEVWVYPRPSTRHIVRPGDEGASRGGCGSYSYQEC